MLGVAPGPEELADEKFPIVPVTINKKWANKITHRDVLGSLMSLQIERDTVGDILVGDSYSVVFAANLKIAQFICDNLSKIASIGVNCTIGKPQLLPELNNKVGCSKAVSSMRLDCVLSALLDKSRSQSVSIIENGLVFINSVLVSSVIKNVREGDKISARGYGKFLIGPVLKKTKSGLLQLSFEKYV
jgi:RNA-binding protein YlmH